MRNRLRVWLLLWLQKRTSGRSGKLADYFSSFVFIEELQGWPLVRLPGAGAVRSAGAAHRAAPLSELRRVETSGDNRRRHGLPVRAAVARRGGEDPFWVTALVTGAFFGFLSTPLWRLAIKTRLKIHFIDGVISWRGPDRKKYRVMPEQRRRMEVIAPSPRA